MGQGKCPKHKLSTTRSIISYIFLLAVGIVLVHAIAVINYSMVGDNITIQRPDFNKVSNYVHNEASTMVTMLIIVIVVIIPCAFVMERLDRKIEERTQAEFPKALAKAFKDESISDDIATKIAEKLKN